MRRIGCLIFPKFKLLDVFGPMEMFGLIDDKFALELIAEAEGAVVINQGLAAHATRTLQDCVDLDVLLVPGGAGTRIEVNNQTLLDWVADTSARAEYTLSVCIGSAVLAKAGVLDGRRATTNKAAFAWVQEQGPAVNWQRQARWVEDGSFLTSSGVSAGMDMALGAIEKMHGAGTARDVAKWCEYTWHEDRDHDPFAKIHGLI